MYEDNRGFLVVPHRDPVGSPSGMRSRPRSSEDLEASIQEIQHAMDVVRDSGRMLVGENARSNEDALHPGYHHTRRGIYWGDAERVGEQMRRKRDRC